MPDIGTIQDEKKRYQYEKPKEARERDGLIELDNKIWTPTESRHLKFSISLSSNCGAGGHRGKSVTNDIVKSKYTWECIDRDYEQLLKA